MNDKNRFYIRILSPVHIGCDEIYEPLGFVVDENAGELTTFDPLVFFGNLLPADKNRFADICRKGTAASLLELNQFMRGRKAEGYRVKTCRGFIEHYKENLKIRPGDEKKIQQELNKFSIFRTAFHEHTNLPYIPGSSIKGALRTAYLNALAKIHKGVRYDDPKKNKYAAQQLEKGLLDYEKLENDPFRFLKVSDFAPVQPSTKIVYAVNEKKKPSKFAARGLYQILEIIEPGGVFMGTISVEDRYVKEAGIKRPLALETILKSASVFYGNEKKREEQELEAVGLPPFSIGNLDGAYPVRIGRHSGAESVTIEGHRDIKIMQVSDKPALSSKTGATTFWLAADVSKNWKKEQLQPFGWAALGKVADEMLTEFEKEKAEKQKEIVRAVPEYSPTSGSEAVPWPVIAMSPLEKLLDELKLIKPTDAGRMGPIIQKMENLGSEADKVAAATAFKDKLGKDLFKKSKFKSRIEALISKGV